MSSIIEIFDKNRPPSKENVVDLSVFDAKEFPFIWPEKSWSNFFKTREFQLFILRQSLEGPIIGMALFEIINDGDVAHLHKIAVDSQMRGQGLARQLMERGLELLQGMGISGIYLEVATGNAAAIALYEKMGLEVKRLVKSFYSNGDDAYIMYNY